MKKIIKYILQKVNLYEYLKYSWLFSLYEEFFKTSSKKNHEREVNLYQSFLSHCDLIFDIGANDGHKTAAFLEISKRVVCYEPDPHSFHKLRVRFRNKKNRVTLENEALSNHEGEAVLYIHHAGQHLTH